MDLVIKLQTGEKVFIMRIVKKGTKIDKLERKRRERKRIRGGLKYLKIFLGRCTEITNTFSKVLGVLWQHEVFCRGKNSWHCTFYKYSTFLWHLKDSFFIYYSVNPFRIFIMGIWNEERFPQVFPFPFFCGKVGRMSIGGRQVGQLLTVLCPVTSSRAGRATIITGIGAS